MTPTALPPPRTPDPMDAPVLRWGILAPGGIAHTFARALRARTGQQLQAVGSRSLERAQSFAGELGVETAYGSYEQLVADPDVDAVYVASPHSEHHDHALLAVGAGKPVLVEKAFTRNAREAGAVFDAAGSAGVFAMEAMWTRFLPHIDVVRRCLEEGVLGEVHTVLADHGQRLYPDGPARLAEPSLAGGALLDLGVYPLSFAHLVLGDVTDVRATGTLTEAGVDAQESITVVGAGGSLGVLGSTMLARTPVTASISGTRARLEISGRFYAPDARVRLVVGEDTVVDEYVAPEQSFGMQYEAAEVARLVGNATESPLMPWAQTLAVMRSMDEVRAQLGVRYPGE